jgi:ferredoxin
MESGGREVQDRRKADKGVAFEDLEECVKKAAEGYPTQVIYIGSFSIGFDLV